MASFTSSAPYLRAVVIGAGIIGASITYWLARRGMNVTVVERQQPATGATRRFFAWINSGANPPASYHDLNRRSLEMWSRFAGELGQYRGRRPNFGETGTAAAKLGVPQSCNWRI